MGRPKGSGNKTDDLKAAIRRIEIALERGGYKDGLELMACRFLTSSDERVASTIWLKLMEWKWGKPSDSEGSKATFNFVVLNQAVVREMNAPAPIESRLLSDSDPSGTAPV